VSKGFRIAGFKVTVDPSLPLVVLLIGLLLTQRYIPNQSYLYGALASGFLTLSILFHELGHAIVAQRLHLTIERIHLFLFGGMAELKNRPRTAGQEALVALAGPFASFLLGLSALGVSMLLPPAWGIANLMVTFLAQMNLLLALFNLIPIYPLDGGRALRALFWTLNGRYIVASHRMQHVSVILILVVMAVAIIDILLWKSPYTLLFFMLSGYLAYTVFTAKKELLQVPELADLIYEPGSYASMNGIDRDMILPVLDSELKLVALRRPMGEPVRMLEGTYIDMDQTSTWSHSHRFAAEVIPVLKDGRVVGVADADELRFWLKEHHDAAL
jgi:Zn-dependent protease